MEHNYYYYILAVVQGIAEFLPISSSGHLVLIESLLGAETHNLFFFNILIHLATLLATIIFYRRDLFFLISRCLSEFFHLVLMVLRKSGEHRFTESMTKKNPGEHLTISGEGDYPVLVFAGKLILTTAVTGIIGITAKPLVENFNHLGALGILFLINAGILWSSRKKTGQNLGLGDLTITAALVIGLAQGFSVLPGISRSGTTITTALLLGLANREALKYSILISIPVISGAFLLEMLEILKIKETGGDMGGWDFQVYAGAFALSFIVGYLSLHLLLKIVKKHRIHLFALYSATLALGLGVGWYWLGN